MIALLSRDVRLENRMDVLHDAYLALIRSDCEFGEHATLRTFVYRVVQITILQKRRRAKRFAMTGWSA